MSAAKPWLKFYPRDWRADEKLRDCSLAARGLWIEMIAIMHTSERYGRLLIGGKPVDAARLSRHVVAPMDEVEMLLSELAEAGVYSVDSAGIIYSRRMKTDEKKAQNARTNGKRGGNPKLCKDSDNSASDKGQDNAHDKGGDILRGQSTETKDKKTSSKKTALPVDFSPEPFGAGTECAAITAGWTATEAARQLEAFSAHHQREGSTFANWQAAWKTWVLNSAKFAARPGFKKPEEDRFAFIDVVANRLREEREWNQRQQQGATQ